jgi:hypothetical protein
MSGRSYKDNGIRGAKGRDKRPAFDKLYGDFGGASVAVA